MQIAILTFDGSNEIDSFVACNTLSRARGRKASIVAPADRVASRSGVSGEAQPPLEFVAAGRASRMA